MAYQNALAYAKDRLQMRSLSGAKAPDKPADPIIVHPDVRKMLMTAHAYRRRRPRAGLYFTRCCSTRRTTTRTTESEGRKRCGGAADAHRQGLHHRQR